MKAFFDTSVLVAVFYGDHIHHTTSLQLFVRFDKNSGCCGAHSLAELYSVLTRMPGKHRVSTDQALLFIENIQERLSVIALTSDDYSKCLKAAAAMRVVGGNTYDFLLGYCAQKARAETIYTWNIRHYTQCHPDLLRRIRTP